MKYFALFALLVVGSCESKVAVIHEGEVVDGVVPQAQVQCNDPSQKNVVWCK